MDIMYARLYIKSANVSRYHNISIVVADNDEGASEISLKKSIRPAATITYHNYY